MSTTTTARSRLKRNGSARSSAATTRKLGIKKLGSKKPGTRKTAAKKAASRKAAPGKAVSKRATAKKAVSKRATARKAVSQRAASKKAAAGNPGASKAGPARKSGPRSAAGRSSRSVDPRVLARRARVARAQGLRRIWTVGLIALGGSLAVGLIAASNSVWLDVETVEVQGAVNADVGQIVTASQIIVGEPLAEVDLSAAGDQVMDVPWVATVEVTRSWRGHITISVQERTTVVAMPAGQRFALVDGAGQQLEVVPDAPDGLIPVAGVDESGVPGQPVSPDGQMVVSLVREIPPELSATIAGVAVEDGTLFMELAGGGRVLLGDDRALPDKLVTLEIVLTRVDLTCLGVIDVEVASAPTVKRRPLVDPIAAAPVVAGEEPKGDEGGC